MSTALAMLHTSSEAVFKLFEKLRFHIPHREVFPIWVWVKIKDLGTTDLSVCGFV